MNVLVMSEYLTANVGKLSSPSVVSTIRNIYTSGQFDSMILIKTEKGGNCTLSKFAQISFEATCTHYALRANVDTVSKVINEFLVTSEHNCLFTVMCTNEYFPDVRKMSAIGAQICFMTIDDIAEHKNFHKIYISSCLEFQEKNRLCGKFAEYNKQNDANFVKKYLEFDINKF